MINEILTGFYNRLRLWPETWASVTAFLTGDIVKAITYASKTYLVTTAGTTGTDEPTWPTSEGSTVSSGTCTFTVKDTKTYNTIAPQSASFPYVAFGHNTSVPIGDFEDFKAVENSTFWANCFSNKSIADVTEIADEVITILDNASLTISGYTNLKTQHEFIGSVIYDNTTNSYQIPLRFRVWNDR